MSLRIVSPIRVTNQGAMLYLYNTYYTMLKKENMDLIITTPSSMSTYETLVATCDGLLLSGGCDIDPKWYNQTLHKTTVIEDPLYEQMEFTLISLFVQANKPILGICRGIQTINVFFHGTLLQDIPSMRPKALHHMQSKADLYSHLVTIQKNTHLSKYTNGQFMTNSYHHQSVDMVAPGFTINAISEDGIIEGIEKDRILAVQWHPEKVDDIHQQQIMHCWHAYF